MIILGTEAENNRVQQILVALIIELYVPVHLGCEIPASTFFLLSVYLSLSPTPLPSSGRMHILRIHNIFLL